MSCDIRLYVDNSNVLQLGTTADPLANSITGTADTGATVTATIYDASGVEVTGQTWPATLTHTAGGIYQKTLNDDIGIVQGRKYKINVHAVGSGGEVGDWTAWVMAQLRNNA